MKWQGGRNGSRGQLKLKKFKLGVESSENCPKAHQGRLKRSKTVRKRVENGPRKVCNGPKRFENGAKSSETVRKRSETLHKRPKSSETVRVRVWLNLLKSKIFSETPLKYAIRGGNGRLTMFVVLAKERTRSESGCDGALQSEKMHIGACKTEPGRAQATPNRA